MSSRCHPATPPSGTAMIAALTMKPIGIEPPSPRKMRAGADRLKGRKPRHAPPSAIESAATAWSSALRARTAAPMDERTATVPAAPSMLSIRLNALTTPTTQTTVSTRSAASLPNTCQPSPAMKSATPAATSVITRGIAPSPTRSSRVPTPNRKRAQTNIGASRDRSPAIPSAPTRKPTTTAAPPRYGVGAA